MAQGKIRWIPHSMGLSLAVAALVSCALLAAGNAHAQSAVFQERFQAAQEQMQAGNFPVAYTILSDLFREDPGNAQVNFSLGRAAFETGRVEEAVMAFERVLMIRPDAPRAKLEIARCYYQLGAYDMAERSFREVLAEDPPQQVRKNIENHLLAITASRKEHFFQGIVSAGVDWDDNVNVAPASDVITIITDLGDLPVRVDRPAGDSITHITADLRYAYMPYGSPLAWKGSILGYGAHYTHEKDLDLSLAEVKAGPSLQRGRFTWDIYALASHITLDDGSYSRTYGAGTALNAMVDANLMIDADLRFRKKNYYEEDANDAENTAFVLAPTWVRGMNRFRTSLAVEQEDAREDAETYWRTMGSVSYERVLPLAFTLLAGYRYQGSWYKEKADLFDEKRQDDVHSYSAVLSKTVFRSPGWGFEGIVSLGYTYTDANSTLPLYTYTKNATSLSLTCAF